MFAHLFGQKSCGGRHRELGRGFGSILASMVRVFTSVVFPPPAGQEHLRLSIARDPSRFEGKCLGAHLHPSASRGVCGALANN